MSRIIDVPKEVVTIQIATVRGDQSIDKTIFEFLIEAVEAWPEFGKGLKAIRQGDKIIKLIESARVQDSPSILLEDADYTALKNAVEGVQWNSKFAIKMLPFMDAVEKAQEVAQTLNDKKAAK